MSDYSDYYSPEKVKARRRAIYVREHAHEALGAATALILREAKPGEVVTIRMAADTARHLAGVLFDTLPPDPDAEPSKPRASVAERLARLADCQTSQDAATVAAYHDHLASSGLQSCGACGVRLEVAVHGLLPAEPEQTRRSCDPGPASEVQP